MKQAIKHIFTLLTLTCGLFACGQQSVTNDNPSETPIYSLTIRTYNHAEMIFTGILTYRLSKDTVTLFREPSFTIKSDTTENDTLFHVLTKPVSDEYVSQLQNINLDSLSDFYYNHCVMTTSGSEYFISVLKDTVTKTIDIHHYYHPQIEKLINEFNEEIPDSLKIDYLTSETRQDCE